MEDPPEGRRMVRLTAAVRNPFAAPGDRNTNFAASNALHGRAATFGAALTLRAALCDSSPTVPPQPGLSATAARLPVDIRRFPWIRRLPGDYAFEYARVADFFSGNPAEPG